MFRFHIYLMVRLWPLFQSLLASEFFGLTTSFSASHSNSRRGASTVAAAQGPMLPNGGVKEGARLRAPAVHSGERVISLEKKS